MTWSPNRRFLRDCDEIIRRGHSMEFTRTASAGRYEFYVDGRHLTRKDIANEARRYRDSRPLTEDEWAKIEAEADELCRALTMSDP